MNQVLLRLKEPVDVLLLKGCRQFGRGYGRVVHRVRLCVRIGWSYTVVTTPLSILLGSFSWRRHPVLPMVPKVSLRKAFGILHRHAQMLMSLSW